MMKISAAAATMVSRQPRSDGQHPAQESRAAVEHGGEDEAADDQQDRLGEEPDEHDARPHAQPHGRAR